MQSSQIKIFALIFIIYSFNYYEEFIFLYFEIINILNFQAFNYYFYLRDSQNQIINFAKY